MTDLTLYFRATENDVEHDYEGGRIVFKPIKAGLPADIIDGALALSASTDAFLRRFPVTRAEKQATFYRLTLEQVPESALPPDPALDAKRKALEAQLAALPPSAQG